MGRGRHGRRAIVAEHLRGRMKDRRQDAFAAEKPLKKTRSPGGERAAQVIEKCLLLMFLLF